MKGNTPSDHPKRQSWKSRVDVVNNILQNLADELRACTSIEPFGSSLFDKDGQTCVDSVIKHRICNKFFRPDAANAAIRREKCYENYINYDNSLSNVRVDLWNHGRIPYLQRRVKSRLSKWLSCHDFTTIDDLDIDFTPGETVISSSGDVSIFAKLDELTHWSCIDVCFDEACKITRNNRSLRLIAMQHLNGVSVSEYRVLYTSCPLHSHREKCEWAWRQLMTEVISVFDADRAGSVFKNIDTDRFIGLGTMFAMIRQRMIASGLRKVLKRAGNDLGQRTFVHKSYRHSVSDAQSVHQILISDRSYATIDFKNASDSTIYQPVEQLVNSNLLSAIDSCRPKKMQFPSHVHTLVKVSSMGVGFTFELMTVLLLACAREFDSTARVYGDDVIIKNNVAAKFIELVASIGYQVNETKTFINSAFRESCGSFYHDDIGYITCYDFTWCKTFQDVIISHNKLVHILKENPNSALVPLLQKALDLIRSSDIPVLSKGPTPELPGDFESNFDLYCYYPQKSVVRLHRKYNSQLYFYWTNRLNSVLLNYQLDSSFVVVKVPVFVNDRSPRMTSSLVKERVRLLHGRESFRILREKGRWHYVPAIITLSKNGPFAGTAGRLTMCSSFRTAQRQLCSR